MFLLPLLLLFVFGAVIISFGFVCSVVFLGERRIWAAMPLSVVIGFNGYLFLLNLISYVISFQLAVWLVLAIFASAVLVFWLVSGRRLPVEPRPADLTSREIKILLLTAAAVSVISGIIGLRTLQYDDLSLTHLPLAATITAGNIPVMDPSAPEKPMRYHYTPEFFTVALNKIARTPLWLGYDIQTFVIAGAIFLMAFLLIWDVVRRFWSAFAGSLLLFYGGGLTWFYFFTEGIGPLWRKYVLGEAVFAPWKFVASMTIPKLWGGFVFIMNGHAAELGLAVTLLVFYLFFRAIRQEERRWLGYAVLAGIFFGYLALSWESNFVVLLAGFAGALGLQVAAAVLRRLGAGWDISFFSGYRRFFPAAIIMMAIAVPLALYQGGVISSYGAVGVFEAFPFARRFWIFDYVEGTKPFALWHWKTLVELGLAPLLIIPALIWFRRQRFLLFLAANAALAFFIPIFTRYIYGAGETKRLFGSLAIPIFALITGPFLVGIRERLVLRLGSTNASRLVFAIIFLIMSSGALFQAVYLITPLGHVGKLNRPFLERPAVRSELDRRVYQWIRGHTTLADRFFPYDKNGTNFIRETGRFIPAEKNIATYEPYPENKKAYQTILERCDAAGFGDMRISYIYISPDFPQSDFEKKCIPRLNVKLVYEQVAGDDFRRIYRWEGLR